MGNLFKNMRNLLPPSKKSLNSIKDLINFRWSLIDKKLNWIAEREELLFWFLQMQPNDSLIDTKLNFFKKIGKEPGHFKNIQLIILSIMDSFNEICIKNDLKYWLWSGTLLGAIRHEGFIPWDEDADVGMPREDFNKFKEIVKPNPRYELVDFYEAGIRPNACGRFSKLVDKECPYPIYLDIFPFDKEFVDDHDEAAKKYYTARIPLEKEIWEKANKLGLKKESRPIEDPEIKFQMDEIFDRYIPKKQEGDSYQWGLELFKAPWIKRFGGGVLLPTRIALFEDREFYVPNDYIKVLNLSFKDWTKLPNDCYSCLLYTSPSPRD